MKIVIEKKDGTVAIMTVIDGADLEECGRQWMELHADEYASHYHVIEDAIPLDRKYRAAWRISADGLSLVIDPDKKKEIDDAMGSA